MFDYSDYGPISDFSDDDVNDSDLNNTIEGLRHGVGCAGLEEPHYNLKQLIKFAGKLKKEQRAMYQISTEEGLKNQARGESALKNKAMSAKKMSNMMISDSAVKNVVKPINSGKSYRKTEGYKI